MARGVGEHLGCSPCGWAGTRSGLAKKWLAGSEVLLSHLQYSGLYRIHRIRRGFQRSTPIAQQFETRIGLGIRGRSCGQISQNGVQVPLFDFDQDVMQCAGLMIQNIGGSPNQLLHPIPLLQFRNTSQQRRSGLGAVFLDLRIQPSKHRTMGRCKLTQQAAMGFREGLPMARGVEQQNQ